jgi:prepilin signal peptidase PulO-like enzyme (type II secretory pathway)
VAYVTGALVGVYLMTQKGKTRTTAVPMGPFLIFGLYFGLFFGSEIARWYMTFV